MGLTDTSGTVAAELATYTGNTPDLILHSLAHFRNRGRFSATFKYQNYEVCDEWFANQRYSVQDGNQVEFRIEFDHNKSWRKVLLDEVTPRVYKDLMKAGYAPWTFGEFKMMWEERRMKMMRGKSALYDYMKERFFQGYHSAFEGLEEDAFAIPTNSADERTAWGVPYWFSMLNTGTVDYTGAFAGRTATYGDSTTTAVIGGLSTATYPHWRNWAANHNGINHQTMDALRLAIIKTNFKPPKRLRQYYSTKTRKLRIYTSLDQLADYERLVNQNPGDGARDLNPFYGEGIMGFRGIDWIGLAVLDGTANSPIYGINFAEFKPIVHAAFWFNTTKPMNDQDNPRLWTVQGDLQYNFGTTNRRNSGFVIHTEN